MAAGGKPRTRAEREVAACRGVANPGQVATTATEDAVELAADIRDLDPRQVWGRLQLWLETKPERLVAACFALAAMVPDDRSVAELLAWTEPFAEHARRERVRRHARRAEVPKPKRKRRPKKVRPMLPDEAVRELRQRHANGEPVPVLAKAFNTTPRSVRRIVAGETRLSAGGPITDTSNTREGRKVA